MTPEEELQQLLDKSTASLAANKNLVVTAIATGLVTLGVTISDARRIAQLVVRLELSKELEIADFPGPDQMWSLIKPWIENQSEEFVGKFFDKIVTGQQLFQS